LLHHFATHHNAVHMLYVYKAKTLRKNFEGFSFVVR
jgi:hypothetical protein